MILCDTGPLVALLDRVDAHHEACAAAAAGLAPEPMLTTHACLTEAMYLVGRSGGWRIQEQLWGYITAGVLRIHVPRAEEIERMLALMRKYSDTPMDFADASLIAASETVGERRVFTTLAVPVMTRLRMQERRVLDTLVGAGVARSRSDALAWCVRLVRDHEGEWIEQLRDALVAVNEARATGPTPSKSDS